MKPRIKTLDQRRAAAQPKSPREELFAERYEVLLGWALDLTHRQRESAEDLVQDAFVHVTFARTRLEQIENLNGYLRRLLRNMSLSRVARLVRCQHDDLFSIADYETFRLGWLALEPERRTQAAKQLPQICAYATELEIDVAYLLSQAKADRNEQVALTRSASGSLRVEGVVDTTERRDEFLRALRPFSNNPAVNTIAVEEELRYYFTRRGQSAAAVGESVRAYSSRVVNQSYRALLQAVELKHVVARFARVDMRTVAPDARTKWLELVHSRALAFERPVVRPRLAVLAVTSRQLLLVRSRAG